MVEGRRIKKVMEEVIDGSFSCVVKTQKRRSKKFIKTELTEIRYKIK